MSRPSAEQSQHCCSMSRFTLPFALQSLGESELSVAFNQSLTNTHITADSIHLNSISPPGCFIVALAEELVYYRMTSITIKIKTTHHLGRCLCVCVYAEVMCSCAHMATEYLTLNSSSHQ